MGKLTIISFSRNDNYRGDLLERIPYHFNSTIETADEVIYVDWGSPSGIDLVLAVKDKLRTKGNLHVIVVSPEQVARFVNNDPNAQACCASLAVNIGVRRATGDWILDTMTDNIMPKRILLDTVMQDSGTFYILSRREIPLEVIQKFDPKDIVALQNWTAEHFNEYQSHGYSGACGGDIWSILDCCGDFQLGTRDVWHKIRGFEESLIYRTFNDSNVNKKAALAGCKLTPIFNLPTMHIIHRSGLGGFQGSGGTNNVQDAIINAGATKNGDSWGFINETFKEYII